MSGAAAALLSGGSMNPITRTYTTGTAATETVPTGASLCRITADGPGGAGSRDSVGLDCWGGGGGGRAVKTIAVTGGNTFTYTVGLSVAGRGIDGNGNSGSDSIVTGTVLGGSVNINAGGGQGGIIGLAADPGGGTGGDTNTTGGSGAYPDGGVGAGGGAGGTGGGAGSVIGGGGSGVTAATSGVGARGEITFYYT